MHRSRDSPHRFWISYGKNSWHGTWRPFPNHTTLTSTGKSSFCSGKDTLCRTRIVKNVFWACPSPSCRHKQYFRVKLKADLQVSSERCCTLCSVMAGPPGTGLEGPGPVSGCEKPGHSRMTKSLGYMGRGFKHVHRIATEPMRIYRGRQK